jgi:hypothetical protein
MTNNEEVFKTTRLPLAAYLHCQRLLPFVACEAVDENTVEFVFSDPERKAEELELSFDQGRDTLVDPRAFVTSERFLKRKLQSALKKPEVR